MELMSEGPFANNKLSGIRTVEAVNAICPGYSILHSQFTRLIVSVPEEPRSIHHVLGNGLQSSDDILVSTNNETVNFVFPPDGL